MKKAIIFNSQTIMIPFLILLTLMPLKIFSQDKKEIIKPILIDINYENDTTIISTLGGSNIAGTINPPSGHGFDLEGNPTPSYHLIRSGLKVWDRNSREFKTWYTPPKLEGNLSCTFENPGPFQDFKPQNNLYSSAEKLNVLKKCLKIKIVDPQNGTVDYDSAQKECEIKKLNNSTLLLSVGGNCFLEAKTGQNLTVEVFSESRCSNRSFLVENNLSPSEISAIIQTYVYPRNEIGTFFEPQETRWEKPLQLNINPGKELLSTTEIEGEEGIPFVRPDYFILPETLVSDILLSNIRPNLARINLKFILSTFDGKSLCQNKLCSNYLNYDIPFVPFFVLKETNPRNGKTSEIYSSFIGDRIPPKWNGELDTNLFLKDINFEAGKKYSIELIFGDPTSNYLELKNAYKSLFKLGSLSLGNTRGARTIGSMGGIGGMGSMGSMGSMGGLGEISFDNISGGLGSMGAIPRIAQTISDPSFPPQYSTVCNKSLSVCNKSNIKKQQQFTINFEVSSIAEGGKIILGDDITLERTGNLYPQFKAKLNLKNKPTIKCSSK